LSVLQNLQINVLCLFYEGQDSTKAASSKRASKNMSDEQRLAVYHFLLAHSDKGKKTRGLFRLAAEKFGVSRRTPTRIWYQAKKSLQDGAIVPDVSSKKHKGRAPKKQNDTILERLADVPPESRTNLRLLSLALNVPKSTLHRRLKEGNVKLQPISKTVEKA
jgi:hypothetical protein